MDQVTSWPEGDHQRWVAEHDGVQERGTAPDAETAHAKAMKSVFTRRRAELDE